MAAAWPWRDFEVMPHTQGQRRSPRKKVGGAKSHLESNPIPTRDTQTNKTCSPGDPTETETELCLSVSCIGMDQQWTATGAGAGVQPQLIQGIRRRDGIGEGQETTA